MYISYFDILIVSCLSFFPSLAPASPQADLSKEQVLAETKRLWQELTHLEVRTSESHPDQGKRGIDRIYKNDFTNDGRYRIESGQTQLATDEHSTSITIGNRKEIIRPTYFEKHPGVLESVDLRPQEGDATRYIGGMDLFLWTFRPDGRPIHRHIEDGATLRRLPGSALYELSSARLQNKLPIKITLDPSHDWLPIEVLLGDELSHWKVEEFRLFAGRWLPASVSKVSHVTDRDGTKRTEKATLKLLDAKVNEPIDPTRFERPAFGDGVLILDTIEGRNYTVGGAVARERLMKLYAP
jgi:hypothetical protein